MSHSLTPHAHSTREHTAAPAGALQAQHSRQPRATATAGQDSTRVTRQNNKSYNCEGGWGTTSPQEATSRIRAQTPQHVTAAAGLCRRMRCRGRQPPLRGSHPTPLNCWRATANHDGQESTALTDTPIAFYPVFQHTATQGRCQQTHIHGRHLPPTNQAVF